MYCHIYLILLFISITLHTKDQRIYILKMHRTVRVLIGHSLIPSPLFPVFRIMPGHILSFILFFSDYYLWQLWTCQKNLCESRQANRPLKQWERNRLPMNATKRDDGTGRINAERSVVHVDQYRRACRRLHLLLQAVLSRRGHALHAPPPRRRSFVARPEGWHGDVVVARRRCPSSSPRGRMRIARRSGRKDP